MIDTYAQMPQPQSKAALDRFRELHCMLSDVSAETGYRQFRSTDLQTAKTLLQPDTDNEAATPIYALQEITGNIEGVSSTDVIPTIFVHDDVISSIVRGSSGIDWNIHFIQNTDGISEPQKIMASAKVAQAGDDFSYQYGTRELFIQANRLHDNEYQRLLAWNQLDGRDSEVITPRWSLYCGFVIPEVHYNLDSMKMVSTRTSQSPTLPEEFTDIVFQEEKLANTSRRLIYSNGEGGGSKVTHEEYAGFFKTLKEYEINSDDSTRLVSTSPQEDSFVSYIDQIAAKYNGFIESYPETEHRGVLVARSELKGMSLRPIYTEDEPGIDGSVNAVLVSDGFVIDCVAKTLFDGKNGCEKVVYTLENNDSEVSSTVIKIASRTYMTISASSMRGTNWLNFLKFNKCHTEDEVHQFIKEELKA